MKKHAILAAALLALAAALPVHAAEADAVIITADKIAPQGKPQLLHEDGKFHVRTLRVKIEPNKDLQPHGAKTGYFIATVISGTLQLGLGSTFDAAKLQTLPAGSVFTHPAGDLHFARTGAEPVVLQLTTVTPADAAPAPAPAAAAAHAH